MSLEMRNQRGKIILLKVLDEINVEQFKRIKFLLSDTLKLNEKMQEEYDEVKIANLMVKKFPRDAGVDKLIHLCKDIPAFQGLVKTLKEEKSKVAKKVKSTPEKGTTPSKKSKQKEDSPSTPAPSTSKVFTHEGAKVTPGPQKRKNTAKEKDGTKRSKVSEKQTQPPCPAGADTSTAMCQPPPPQTSSAPFNASLAENPKPPAKSQVTPRKPNLQKGPMVVMVLNAADPFAYESSEKETKKMFHATVATEKQFFHMKVLNINLKKIFTRKRIITISDYFEYDHLLEVNEASSVSEAGPDQKIEVPNNIINTAKKTLPIHILQRQASGTIVYGLYTLCKKTVNKNNTIYEIQYNEEKMEVVGKGKCHDIPCEEGDKLQLFCFRLRKNNGISKLISEIHSFIQVKTKANQKKSDLKTTKPSKEQSEAPKHSEAGAPLTQSHPQTPQMPPAAPFSTFLLEKGEDVPGAETSSSSVRGSTPTVHCAYGYMLYPALPYTSFLNEVPPSCCDCFCSPMSLDMTDECYKIVLLKVLEDTSDYQFKMVKFLLASTLNLSNKMQEKYDKVQIANLMVDKFPRDAGVDKLMQLCKDIPALQPIAKTLNNEKSKVVNKIKSTPAKGTTLSKKSKQKEEGPATPAPSTRKGLTSEGAEVTPGPQKRKSTTKGKSGSERSKVSEEQTQPPSPAGAGASTAVGHPPPPQTSSAASSNSSTENPKPPASSRVTTRANNLRNDPMVVMVLKAGKRFEYESPEKETKKMFHATVATEKKFFHVKVLNDNLRKTFIRNRIITISNYLEYKHLLEVNEASTVSEAGRDVKIEVPDNIKKSAKETLKIDIIKVQASGTIVYGSFMLHKVSQTLLVAHDHPLYIGVEDKKVYQGFQIPLDKGALGIIAVLEMKAVEIKRITHRSRADREMPRT
ncbi:PREDICTED: pyrin and HIN domain-containing protein 1-like, partial [Propithecus coquereli]|uniref:pyrin and HIN domain-containing protein 1-like n=1 Tax=Propithecus coquereli TaxID=379532 RepID=UPI00063EEBF8